MKYRRGVFCIIERDVLYNPLGSQNIVKYEKKIECSRKKVSGYSEREIWILTEGLNGGVVTYPSLAGFTHTLHTLFKLY